MVVVIEKVAVVISDAAGAAAAGQLILKSIDRLFKGAMEEAKKFADKSGKIVLEKTLPITPRQFGGLRQSGRTSVEVKSKTEVISTVSFGGADFKVDPTPNAPDGFVFYAVNVHEDTTKKHKTGQAKFLETGVKLSMSEVDELFKNTMKAVVK